MNNRERLGSRLGFILLSAGCAIGCGNVWKFPWMAGQYVDDGVDMHDGEILLSECERHARTSCCIGCLKGGYEKKNQSSLTGLWWSIPDSIPMTSTMRM